MPRMLTALFAIVTLSVTMQASACDGVDKGTDNRLDIVSLIDGYSERTGQKFVLDPRVKANVTLLGVDANNIDYRALVGILTTYGFGTVESDDVIYVVPDILVGEMSRKLGLSGS